MPILKLKKYENKIKLLRKKFFFSNKCLLVITISGIVAGVLGICWALLTELRYCNC